MKILTPQAACDELTGVSSEEIRRYLASIGSKGGKAGTGASKVRGGTAYYKRISKLAAQARKARQHQNQKRNQNEHRKP